MFQDQTAPGARAIERVGRRKLLQRHAARRLEQLRVPPGNRINSLARDLHVPPNRIHSIAHGTRAITADTALRLGTYFGVTPEMWLNLQSEYDLRGARRIAGGEIAKTVRKREAA